MKTPYSTKKRNDPNPKNTPPTAPYSIHHLLLLSLFFIYITPSYADEMSLILNGRSVHFEERKDGQGEEWNEENFGIGLQYDQTIGRSQSFISYNANYFIDSYNNPTWIIGIGLFERNATGLRIGTKYHIDFGINAFIMQRQYVNNGHPFPGALPFVSIGNEHAALNVTYIPQLDTSDLEVPSDVLFFQLKLKLFDTSP